MIATRRLSARVALAALLLPLALLPRASRAGELPDDCMPFSELRPGMIGEALSVHQGFHPVSYRVEILGVEAGALPGSPMILARVEGPGIEKHGIVAGMSGSPVLIDGKYIGAIAYGWSFSYTPVAGITPIERMLTIWDELESPPASPAPASTDSSAGAADPDRSSSPASGAAGATGTPWDWRAAWEAYRSGASAESALAPVTIHPTSPAALELSEGRPFEMKPLAAPIFAGGASARSLELVGPIFRARGLELMGAGSSAGSDESPAEPSPEIVAGSGIAIPMLSGDTSIAGIGTVTYRKGDRLLAFGHPMFGAGNVNAPMAPAYIFGYMQSYGRSFKLGESREVVGAIRQDRGYSIGGVFGPGPPRVPISVRVSGPGAANPRSFSYSAWKDRDFLPSMTAVALLDSVSAAASDAGDGSARLDWTIRLGDGGEIRKRLVASSRSGVGFEFFFNVMMDSFMLVGNPFREIDVASVEMDVEVTPEFRVDRLLRATPRRARVEPGETLALTTVWQPFRGAEYERVLEIPVPADLADGSYVLHLLDAAGETMMRQRRDPGAFQPRSAEDVLALVRADDVPANRVHLHFMEPGVGSGVGGRSLEGAPASMQGLVAATAPFELQSPVIGRELAVVASDFDAPVTARATLQIEVARRRNR